MDDVKKAIKSSGFDYIEQPPNVIVVKQDDTDLGTLKILVITTNDEMKVEQERIKKIQANEMTQKGVTTRFENVKNVMFEYKVPSTMSDKVATISKKLKESDKFDLKNGVDLFL